MRSLVLRPKDNYFANYAEHLKRCSSVGFVRGDGCPVGWGPWPCRDNVMHVAALAHGVPDQDPYGYFDRVNLLDLRGERIELVAYKPIGGYEKVFDLIALLFTETGNRIGIGPTYAEPVDGGAGIVLSVEPGWLVKPVVFSALTLLLREAHLYTGGSPETFVAGLAKADRLAFAASQDATYFKNPNTQRNLRALLAGFRDWSQAWADFPSYGTMHNNSGVVAWVEPINLEDFCAEAENRRSAEVLG